MARKPKIVIDRSIVAEYGSLTIGTLVAFDISPGKCFGRFGRIEGVNLSDGTVTIDDYPYGFHLTVRHSSDCKNGKMVILGREIKRRSEQCKKS